jgi:hypothetical protein
MCKVSADFGNEKRNKKRNPYPILDKRTWTPGYISYTFSVVPY